MRGLTNGPLTGIKTPSLTIDDLAPVIGAMVGGTTNCDDTPDPGEPLAFTTPVPATTPASSPTTGSVGGSVTPAATATSGLAPTITVDSASTSVCSFGNGATAGVVTFNHVGTCTLDANQAGNSDYNPAPQVQAVINVGQANQTVMFSTPATTPTSAVAGTMITPAATASSGLTPTITVDSGSTSVCSFGTGANAAVVTMNHGGTCILDANQAGDNDYIAAPQVQAVINVGTIGPHVVTHLSSAHRKTKAGWYRSPVTVSFTCTAGSAPLAHPYAAPVTLTKNKANQTVTVTVTDTDGGENKVTVSAINIDRIKPKLHITGATNGHAYRKLRHLICHAHDALSGLASCVIHQHRRTHHGVTTVRWKAVATDKAGNRSTRHGNYRLIEALD